MRRAYQPGDWVVFRKTKFSTHPGPRAHQITPAAHGDEYAYIVDKYWVVVGLEEDGRVRIRTPRGKEHFVRQDHSNLRRANWWERWRHRNRFESAATGQPPNVEDPRPTARTA